MAAKVRIELDSDGIAELLKSAEVAADMKRRGDNIAESAGDGFEVTEFEGKYGGSPRAMVSVKAKTREAKIAEATDKSLTRAIDAGRQ